MTESLPDIVAWLDEKPSLARYVGAARKLDALAEETPDAFLARRILVVRNFTIEPIEPILKVAAYRNGLKLDVAYSGYEPGTPETFAALPGTDVVILALRLEELSPKLTSEFLDQPADARRDLADGAVDYVVQLASTLKAQSSAALLVHNFAAPLRPSGGLADAQHPLGQLNLIRRANVDLAASILELDGAHILDVDHVFATLGHAQTLDARGARGADAPLGQPALRALADAQVRHIKALRGAAAKLVIVDCDNTLWGGVVGEDGISGIVLGETGAGRRHRDLQRQLLDLKARGIVLAISSKNEEADVMDVLDNHPDALLKRTDIAAHRINWEDKATSVRAITEELNLGLQHAVFVDDNPVECAWVREQLPEVRVVEWPGDLADGNLDDLGLFDALTVTDEDRKRTEMYRAEGERRTAQTQGGSMEDYLRSLQMTATIGLTTPERLPRVAQLIQKTNQFNLTTRRHDQAQVEAFIADEDSAVIWLELADRFGSNGVIGVGILRVDGDVAHIDTLLMSCRVIGRGAENLLVNRLGTLARDMGAGTLVGEYIPSERNAQVADLYTRLDFSGPEGGPWEWDLSAGAPPVPDWFEITEAEGAQA